jgi:hypothetical protein
MSINNRNVFKKFLIVTLNKFKKKEFFTRCIKAYKFRDFLNNITEFMFIILSKFLEIFNDDFVLFTRLIT